MIDYKSKFSEFSKPSFFSRIDTAHILNWHIGVDDFGRKSLEFRSKFTARKVVGTKYIEVSQYKKEEYCTIRFSLVDQSLEDLFYKFCDDIVEKTRGVKDSSLGYNAIIDRFLLWKRLFVSAKDDILSEKEIMGLMGELIFLKDFLFPLLGYRKAIEGWSGQDRTKKDFSFSTDWYEVKTVSCGKDTVLISSMEQLDSENSGVLAVVFLEKMSQSYKGITLNSLVCGIIDLIDNEGCCNSFLEKIEKSCYAYNVTYDSIVFQKKGIKRYQVDDSFPKITSSSVPVGIVAAEYQISISAIANKEIK